MKLHSTPEQKASWEKRTRIERMLQQRLREDRKKLKAGGALHLAPVTNLSAVRGMIAVYGYNVYSAPHKDVRNGKQFKSGGEGTARIVGALA